MNLVLVRDQITYQLSTTCTFEVCITGRLPPQPVNHHDALEQEKFFEHAATILNHHTQSEQEIDNDEDFATGDDEVPF